MYKSMTMSAALAVALSVVAAPESFARGGHFGGWGGGGGIRMAGAGMGMRMGGASFAHPAFAPRVAMGPNMGQSMGPRMGVGPAWNGGWNHPPFHHHRHFFPGLGFGAGLAVGAAFAAPYYYSDPYYYDDGYYYGDAAPAAAPDDAVAYCMQRYQTYDPASGTFLGYDGLRHPCP